MPYRYLPAGDFLDLGTIFGGKSAAEAANTLALMSGHCPLLGRR